MHFGAIPVLNAATLVLAHHGTAGALLAEALAFELAVPGQTQILHLLVVPDFWAGMQGDDWLNNAATRDAFGHYVEGLLKKDVADRFRALQARCAGRGIPCRSIARYGDPAESLIQVAEEEQATLVVIGPPRPKGTPGLRSRMDLEPLARRLRAPLLIANYPR